MYHNALFECSTSDHRHIRPKRPESVGTYDLDHIAVLYIVTQHCKPPQRGSPTAFVVRNANLETW